jgi:dienelactone hydrolase
MRRVVCLAALALACGRQRFEPARFDLAAARRTSDLQLERRPSAAGGERARVEEVTWASTQWTANGEARPIRIHGYLAHPRAGGSRPAVLIAHGLGQQADPAVAIDVAADLGAVALALSGPGMGRSTGRAVTFEDPGALFDAAADVRGSWLYAYVFALLRATTMLAAEPDVDGRTIVASGTSLGGVALLVANGADDRLAGVLAVSASGGLAASADEGSWFRKLVESANGLHVRDPGPARLFAALDPLVFAERQHGAVVLLAGAQDEFFPLDQLLRTFAALRAPRKSLALVANYDHDWYFTDRHDEVIARWAALLRRLVQGAPLPAAPVVTRTRDGVEVSAPRARAVRIAVSEDGGGSYQVVTQLRRGPARDAILFAEAMEADGAVATSVPELPPGFRPIIRPFRPLPGRDGHHAASDRQ